MCGEYSENAEMPCGMKLCCSAMGWCGTTADYCHNADPVRGSLPCQAGYGSCSISGSPSCPAGGGSTKGRTVGYYQSWNVRNRACNKVSPSQLNTTAYTHLFYSFASIDPVSFRISPAHSDDLTMMREFTALSKGGKLQTWIAVGGFDFSDPGTPTHTTWSDMCSTMERRAAFISSVKAYMDEYGFQGVDLDWEYPGAPERGGRKLADTRNLIQLVREMRAAYGTAYGISLTLAPDYWYLRWFDAKAMEPYVDFFGFMAYDLHGSWDQDVKALGKRVRGQADIREIANNTIPLWFDGLNPAKINFGLAMYGRGYTLANPSCNQLLCSFNGPSKPAPCTNFPGVMSLLEIQQLIKRRGLTPQYLPDSMMKQITWDDQWIGYDDDETFAAKKAWADSRCFGGSMVWSIDFQVPGSGGSEGDKYGEVVYVGTEVYQRPTAQCPAPCIMVFPPSTLEKPTAITLVPYTATLEVGSTTTTVVAVPTPRTTTVTVINFFNYYVTSDQQPGAPLTLRPSFQAPPVPVLVTGPDGRTTTRTVVPPPLGEPTGPGGSTTGQPDEPATEWPFIPPPTPTPDPGPEEVDEGMFPPVSFPEWTDSPDTSTTMTWPLTGTIEPVTDTNKPTPARGSRVSCKAWFFFVCISWDDLNLKVDFWDIVLPPGRIGPGPPPASLFRLPSGWRFGCPTCLPPWPPMSVNPQGQLANLPPKPTPCEPTTAMLTIESTSYGTTTTEGTIRTTASRTFSREFPMLGCSVEDSTTAATTTACDAPTPRAVAPARAPMDEGSDVDLVEPAFDNRLAGRAPDCNDPALVDVVMYPENHFGDYSALKAKLSADSHPNSPNGRKLESFNVIEAPAVGLTAFIYLANVQTDYVLNELNGQFGLSKSVTRLGVPVPPPGWTSRKRAAVNETADDNDVDDGEATAHQGNVEIVTYHNDTETANHNKLGKRFASSMKAWAPSQLSVPPRRSWLNPANGYIDRNTETWRYLRHESECEGQYVYITEDDVDVNHPFLAGITIERLDHQVYGNWRPFAEKNIIHGTRVASMVAGSQNGVCPQGKVRLVRTVNTGTNLRWLDQNSRRPTVPGAQFVRLESLVLALQDIYDKIRGPAAVVVMSWGLEITNDAFRDCLLLVLQALDRLGTVLVAASGNWDNDDINVEHPIHRYPALWANDPSGLPNLIVVGASDIRSRVSLISEGGSQLTVYAPGHGVETAKQGGGMESATGTSYAAPLVAGLVAYFRALPNLRAELETPSTVKKLVQKMGRTVQMGMEAQSPEPSVDSRGNRYGRVVAPVWNGQLTDSVSCLVQMNAPGCPVINLNDNTPIGDICANNPITRKRGISDNDDDQAQQANQTLAIRQEGGNCPLDPGLGGGNGGGQGPTRTITYASGTPSPTCTANCGTLCTGYWCRPASDRPSQPPHFTDPTNLPPDPTELPTLPPDDNNTLPTNCISSTIVSVCNGAGVGKACQTSTRCLATTSDAGPFPTLPPNDPPIPTNCVSTSSWTECAQGPGGGRTACVTHSSCVATKTPDDDGGGGGPTGTVPSGFPQPTAIPNVSEPWCMRQNCRLYPNLIGVCDEEAWRFLQNEDGLFGTGDGQTSSLCLTAMNSAGELVGCIIKLQEPESASGSECVWTGREAATWYSNFRAKCGGLCGWVENSVSGCYMSVDFTDSCEKVSGG
ncbi:hypothetical protein VTI74DRAFT_154 [Chaetomium olivicolor]